MTEDEIVAAVAALARGTKASGRIRLGIGDDAAVWQPSRSHRSVISSDMQVEGVHFRRDAMSLADAGWRALGANLSDLAAMGARPVLATVAFGVPAASDIMAIYAGVAEASRCFKIPIVGGDLSRSDMVTISISVVGEVRPSNCKTRAGAHPNDILAVTGELGAARAGLELAGRPALFSGEPAKAALQAFRRPQPRLAEGRFLAASANVTAMMDCSDGLSVDVPRLCAASGCGATLETIPVAAAAAAAAQALGEDPESFALAGGEDFELIVAIAPRAFGHLSQRYAQRFRKPLLRIGTVTRETGVRCHGAPLPPTGWDHFK